jgi:hypothetical protein
MTILLHAREPLIDEFAGDFLGLKRLPGSHSKPCGDFTDKRASVHL